MPSPAFRPRTAIRALVLASLLATPACRAHSHHWSFSVTRSVYGGHHSGHYHGHDESLWLAIFLVPVVIDLILLPVTGTHDLCY